MEYHDAKKELLSDGFNILHDSGTYLLAYEVNHGSQVTIAKFKVGDLLISKLVLHKDELNTLVDALKGNSE